MTELQIAHAGIDPDLIIFAVIVIFSVVGRAIQSAAGKAAKQAQPGGGPPSAPRPTPGTPAGADDPAAELRRFLESLSGEPTPAAPTVPPVSPLAPPPIPPALTPVSAPRKPVPPPAPRRRATVVLPTEMPLPHKHAYGMDLSSHRPAEPRHGSRRPSFNQGALMDMLKAQNGLQQAIVLREVLGPPRGLQSVPFGGASV